MFTDSSLDDLVLFNMLHQKTSVPEVMCVKAAMERQRMVCTSTIVNRIILSAKDKFCNV